MMRFKNDSSSDMPAFSIVNLTGATVGDDGVITLTADQCDSAANFLLATTGLEEVKAGKYGRCNPIGHVFFGKYDTADGTPANEENWGPDNGTLKLKKNFGGGHYAVIGSDSDSEVAVVMHTGVVERWGKADANIAGAASGTVSIYVGTGASTSWTDSGDNVTARNLTDQQGDSGNYLLLKYAGSQWNFLPLECPA
jgi:hypothetical protein